MREVWRFPIQVLLTIIGAFLISAYPLTRNYNQPIISSIIIGCALSTINVIIGYFIIVYAINKSNRTFFKSIIGGMILRLFLVATSTVVLIKVFYVEMIGFLISMLFFYFIFLILEVNYLNKRLIKRYYNT